MQQVHQFPKVTQVAHVLDRRSDKLETREYVRVVEKWVEKRHHGGRHPPNGPQIYVVPHQGLWWVHRLGIWLRLWEPGKVFYVVA